MEERKGRAARFVTRVDNFPGRAPGTLPFTVSATAAVVLRLEFLPQICWLTFVERESRISLSINSGRTQTDQSLMLCKTADRNLRKPTPPLARHFFSGSVVLENPVFPSWPHSSPCYQALVVLYSVHSLGLFFITLSLTNPCAPRCAASRSRHGPGLSKLFSLGNFGCRPTFPSVQVWPQSSELVPFAHTTTLVDGGQKLGAQFTTSG